MFTNWNVASHRNVKTWRREDVNHHNDCIIRKSSPPFFCRRRSTTTKWCASTSPRATWSAPTRWSARRRRSAAALPPFAPSSMRPATCRRRRRQRPLPAPIGMQPRRRPIRVRRRRRRSSTCTTGADAGAASEPDREPEPPGSSAAAAAACPPRSTRRWATITRRRRRPSGLYSALAVDSPALWGAAACNQNRVQMIRQTQSNRSTLFLHYFCCCCWFNFTINHAPHLIHVWESATLFFWLLQVLCHTKKERNLRAPLTQKIIRHYFSCSTPRQIARINSKFGKMHMQPILSGKQRTRTNDFLFACPHAFKSLPICWRRIELANGKCKFHFMLSNRMEFAIVFGKRLLCHWDENRNRKNMQNYPNEHPERRAKKASEHKQNIEWENNHKRTNRKSFTFFFFFFRLPIENTETGQNWASNANGKCAK